jgi:multicomponent Na+:H+ antiporter subunit C
VILLAAFAIGVIFAAGVYLVLKRDLVRIAVGTLLVSNSAILLVVSAGFGEREEPIAPLAAPERVSDPLVQALALTAIVIGFAITALLLEIALAVERSHRTLDVQDLVAAEADDEAHMERGSRAPGSTAAEREGI